MRKNKKTNEERGAKMAGNFKEDKNSFWKRGNEVRKGEIHIFFVN